MPLSRIKTTSITDVNVTTTKIANDAVTLAKMAPGTDGNIISYDASQNPVAVATGSAGQILTSAGAGAPPTFATPAAQAGGQFIDTQTVKAVYYNHNAITASITIAATRNAFSAGPITVSSGATVTIAAGGTYTLI